MINNKSDLKHYLLSDYERNLQMRYSSLQYYIKLLYGSESAKAYRYLKSLRYYEYSINKRNKTVIDKLLLLFRKWYNHVLSAKYNIVIGPNMVGPGFRMPHLIGGGIIINCISMGKNCSANTNVLVGNKGDQEHRPVLGDNVTLTTGCVVYGKITLGDNVTVAPNSVVFKDVPSNCVVSGIPATIIKRL